MTRATLEKVKAGRHLQTRIWWWYAGDRKALPSLGAGSELLILLPPPACEPTSWLSPPPPPAPSLFSPTVDSGGKQWREAFVSRDPSLALTVLYSR